MIQLIQSLQAWNSAEFEATLKREIRQLRPDQLPLQNCLRVSSVAKHDNLDVIMLSANDDARHIYAKTGIFFNGVIPGCACADDPTPESDYTEYCVLQFSIDKQTAQTDIAIITTE